MQWLHDPNQNYLRKYSIIIDKVSFQSQWDILEAFNGTFGNDSRIQKSTIRIDWLRKWSRKNQKQKSNHNQLLRSWPFPSLWRERESKKGRFLVRSIYHYSQCFNHCFYYILLEIVRRYKDQNLLKPFSNNSSLPILKLTVSTIFIYC